MCPLLERCIYYGGFFPVQRHKCPFSPNSNLVGSLEDFIKVTVSRVSALTGYQFYKRRCGGGNADSEAAVEGDQEKFKDVALDNNAYESAHHDGDKDKSKDSDKNTKL